MIFYNYINMWRSSKIQKILFENIKVSDYLIYIINEFDSFTVFENPWNKLFKYYLI